MSADLYMSVHLAQLDRTLVIEGDGFSVWAYMLQEDEQTIDFDGFLCSSGMLVESTEEVERFIKEGNQPPLLKEYANEHSVVPELQAEDIQVEVLDAATIIISLKGKEYLLMDVEEKQSYSIAVVEDGPYGFVLSDEEEGTDAEDDQEEE